MDIAAKEIIKTGQTTRQTSVDAFAAIRNEMNRVFEKFEHGWRRWPSIPTSSFAHEMVLPEVDIHENKVQFVVEVDLAGVAQKDISVTVSDGILTIKGEKKIEREVEKETYYMSERSFGTFERCLSLPDSIDENKLEARFLNGVLKITAPKKPGSQRTEKKIEIKNA